ncbi:phosphonate ABC transporter, permease protein PhnE [Phreatobacter cathodiphilus]|uniref:Phosphonate ABC transporter, permease protein PhnE n=1 Tax=Phreatobacter cathodiphilus TaxID=1868589 RepID=A0A2S0NCM8_9HYPH|nr:phosphonate ABC transporter, permease protein PhnE [Phreatobacter cathodiphilus]AVO45929.1 phosphonate ABC transporter, permease protein PhnE [Phreatobacter cathodiphilus]
MTMPTTDHPLRLAARADRDGLIQRHPEIFRPSPARRIRTGLILALLAGLFAYGLVVLDFDAAKLVTGVGKLGQFLWFMLPPSTGTWAKFFVYLHALAETVAIAFLGTFTAAMLALPVGFLAAKNVVPNVVVHFLSRRIVDTIRGVDELIWALIWVSVVGLGPFAGVLALLCANVGLFSKLFSEAIEAADRKASEGISSTGGGKLHGIRFAILPQVLPIFGSQVLYFFESNTRSATIIGIVGAGGIGLHLAEQIRVLEYQHVSALILMILVTVAIIDQVSTRLRFALIGERGAP